MISKGYLLLIMLVLAACGGVETTSEATSAPPNAPENTTTVCEPFCMAFQTDTADDLTSTDCEVAYAADTLVTVYFLPDVDSSVFAVSTAGDDAAGAAQARTATGWIGFDPGVAQADREGLARLRWIQAGDAVTLSGDQCEDLPLYTVQRVE